MRFLSVCRLIAVIWQVQAWRYGAQIERLSATQTQATLQQQRAEQARRVALEQQLSTSDTQHARELSDAHHHQAVLRDRLVIAEVRLSVLLDAFSDCSVPAGTPPPPAAWFMQPREPDFTRRMLSELSASPTMVITP